MIMSYSAEEFYKYITAERKNHKAKWFFFVGYVENKFVEIKCFKTWLQIFKVDGITYPCPMEISVKEFNEVLKRPFLNKELQ